MPNRLREKLGIQLQDTQLSEKLTVVETLRLFRSFYVVGREIDEVIDSSSLARKGTRGWGRCRVGRSSDSQLRARW